MNLTEWAAISEIVGNAAVIVSLLIVAFQISQNTTAIKAQIDNQWYDSQHANLSDSVNNTDLLALSIKAYKREPLDELEQERFNLLAFRHMIHWEHGYARYNNGFVESAQWQAIDKSYSIETPQFVSEEWWRKNTYHFREDFIEHVDSVYRNSKK